MKILQLWGLSELGRMWRHFVESCRSNYLLLNMESLQEGVEQTIFLEKALKCAARCCKSKLIGKSDYAGEFSGAVTSRL